MARGIKKDRDLHRDFVAELISELISGEWEQAPSDEMMLFDDEIWMNRKPQTPVASEKEKRTKSPASVNVSACSGKSSKVVITEGSWKKRQCIICRWEGRKNATVVTQYCEEHKVCLCQNKYAREEGTEALVCPQLNLNCWEKFHQFYLQKGLFTDKGHVKSSSALCKEKKKALNDKQLHEEVGMFLSQCASNNQPFQSMLFSQSTPGASSNHSFQSFQTITSSVESHVSHDFASFETPPNERSVRRNLSLSL